MKAIMLIAGVGDRLFGDDNTQLPKALIKLEGKSLLRRHIENLLNLGFKELVLICGYRMNEVVEEANYHSPSGFIQPLFNPSFREGSLVSLWTARSALCSGENILLMDADVLYDSALLRRLVCSKETNCFLLDREVDDSEEAVKICVRDGELVDFGKTVGERFDLIGEWPGFLRMSPNTAKKLADTSNRYISDGRRDAQYEMAIRDVLLAEPPGLFRYEDISGIPWIEIDFPSDLERAEKVILPLIAENRI